MESQGKAVEQQSIQQTRKRVTCKGVRKIHEVAARVVEDVSTSSAD